MKIKTRLNNRLDKEPSEKFLKEMQELGFPKDVNVINAKERISSRRIELGLMQEHVATAIGMNSRENYSNAERANTSGFFTIPQLYNLLEVLGLTYEYVFYGVKKFNHMSPAPSKLMDEIVAKDKEIANLREFSSILSENNGYLKEKVNSLTEKIKLLEDHHGKGK